MFSKDRVKVSYQRSDGVYTTKSINMGKGISYTSFPLPLNFWFNVYLLERMLKVFPSNSRLEFFINSKGILVMKFENKTFESLVFISPIIIE
ncbi:MAG TPA: hypothetical protein ENG45_02000 [Candidatus Aenigmarchaeota archaeon]|nr:hypothetical protein [Candidatus Aenigmarchaeota archaeon]